ncbi:hypothetical protein [Mesorhizobium silamurunense]|uniref:hypothetical protein n=1 Tax=Mesorhizobium silamurunense TaxID=499528 RepID=UPI0035E43AE1
MRAPTRRPVKLSNFFRKIHGPTGAVEAGSFETNRSWLALAPGVPVDIPSRDVACAIEALRVKFDGNTYAGTDLFIKSTSAYRFTTAKTRSRHLGHRLQ